MTSLYFRRFWQIYALLTLPILIGVASFGYVSYLQSHDLEELERKHQVNALIAEVTDAVSEVKADVFILEKSLELKDFLYKDSIINEAVLLFRLQTFMKEKSHYDQVRLINLKGNEVARINRTKSGLAPVSSSGLQNKKDSSYFKASLALSVGEVFVSRLDLNVENGKVEEPWKPVFRVVTPYADRIGNIQGFLVVNVSAIDIMRRFKTLFNGYGHRLRLLNDKGFWIYHPDEQQMFGELTGKTPSMINSDPEAWSIINSQSKGEVYGAEGNYIFDTYYLNNQTIADDVDVSAIDKWWKVVSQSKPKKLIENTLDHMRWSLYLIPVFLFLSWVFSRSWANSLVQQVVLRERESRLFNVIEQSSELVMVTDEKANIEYVNPAFEQVTGYSQEELIGKNPRIFNSGVQDAYFYHQLWDNLIQKNNFTAIFVNKKKDGSNYYEHKQITPVFDAEGKIIQYLSLGKDISKQKEFELLAEQMRDFAMRDALTGVANRAALPDLMANALLRTKRNETLMLILYVDIDDFKSINDHHGHEMGDKCIKHVVEKMRHALRETDYVIRLGGDEFLAVLEGFSHVDDMKSVIEEVLSLVVPTPEMIMNNIQLKLSIGATIVPFGEESDFNLLVAEADTAMYSAKLAGGARCVFYEPRMKEGIGLTKLG